METNSFKDSEESILPPAVAFIRSDLDDYGLSVTQYRAFCRIARRGDCFESIPQMAAGCRMNAETMRAAIAFLCERRLVKRLTRSGQTSVLRIMPLSQWKPPLGKEGVGGNEGSPLVSDHPLGKEGVGTPRKRGDTKVIPEGNPIRGAGLPKFEPIRRGLFPREYAIMIEDQKRQLKREQKEFSERTLKSDAISLIAWIEKDPEWSKKPDERVRRIRAIEQDPSNYSERLTPHGEEIRKCRLGRIEEIERAKRGEWRSHA
jgi:hypothetical protein